jgi:DNA-directed RNA polymerase
MDALDLTIDRLRGKQQKTISRFGAGDTTEGLAFTEVLYGDYLSIFSERTTKARSNRGFRGKQRLLLELEPSVITALALNAGISALCAENDTLANALRQLGLAAQNQCHGYAFGQWDKKEAARIEALAKSKNSSLKQRKAAARAFAHKMTTFRFENWSDSERLVAGRWILEGLLEGSAFCLDSENRLSLTEEALAQLDAVNAMVVMKSLLGLPVTGDLPDWEKSTIYVDNLPYNLIRSYQKPVRAHVDKAIRSGQMAPVLEALNHAQATKWRISEAILYLVKHCYNTGIRVEGLPSLKDLPMPDHPLAWDDMTVNQRKAWKRKASEVAQVNRGLDGERKILSRDLAIADWLVGKTYSIPHNLDYRGRVYGIPHFQFQRQDHIRAMFQFAEGQVLDTEGLYWLKVHVANTGDFKKVSKQSFDERVWWVDDNIDAIIATGRLPLDNLWWLKADKPFMFVAACMALGDALEGRPVHIPVSFDGSCSGLQHLAAQSNCSDTGALVNLKSAKKPADIYSTVADLVKVKVKADLTSTQTLEFKISEEEIRTVKVADLAKMLSDYGVTRSLVKRNTMTFCYSSKRSGMQTQILEDTMRPLQLQVLAGEIPHHPFGEDGGFAAARYLSGLTYNSIVETVSKPAEVMRYLQNVARVMSHEGLPTYWTTPLGFPVMLRCPNTDTECLKLFLHDKKIKLCVQPRTQIETGGISKQLSVQAVAPSFIHAYDACHLMMVVLAAKKEGINSLALVHDSFGCLPNDAARFRKIIQETFVELYTKNQPLKQIRQENCVHLVTNGYKLPELPSKGDLNIEEILNAEYAFA